jgi:chorismate synthase
MALSYQTAGESHGPALIATVTGMPAGVPIDLAFINGELARRQGGYGRGGRQRIETDTAEVLTGVRRGRTIGSPVTLLIANKDSRLDDLAKTPPVHTPRPGHADLAGSLKYLTTDCRETLERASARETAARVAAGALARCLLRHEKVDIEVFAFTRSILTAGTGVEVTREALGTLRSARDASETYCPDVAATSAQHEVIRQAKIDKDTVGGIVECHAFNVPPGLGSTMDWRDKLDARLAYAVMSIQAIKGVEIGLGMGVAARPGSRVHDPIGYDANLLATASLGFVRPSNNAGGTEGGMSNGAPIVVRAAMKPISTLLRGMPSVDLTTRGAADSAYERSDICAVPAASVVLENTVGFELARALLEKFGGDSLPETLANYGNFLRTARTLPMGPASFTIA